MPKKLGNGGNGLEEYDSKTGEYISDGKPNKYYDNPNENVLNNLFGVNNKNNKSNSLDDLFGISSKEKINSKDLLPKTTSKLEKRKWAADMSINDFARYDKMLYDIVGDIIYEINERALQYQTINDNSYERILLRKKIINDEINQQKQKKKSYERKAIIVLGLPASGKSSISDRLENITGSYIIDADNIKKRIPEYQQDKKNLSVVHSESVNISNTMMSELSSQGANMIIGKVGGYYEDIKDIVDNLSKDGYTCDVILNDVPFDITIERNLERYKQGKTDRIVPLSVIYDSDGKIQDTYDRLMELDNVNGGAIYSNDVPYGQAPKLITTHKKAERLIINE